jgi:tetratricopeptide (TPR) repeat protein
MKNLILILCVNACLPVFANSQDDSASFYFQKGLVEKKERRYLVAHQAFEKAIGFNSKNSQYYLENASVLNEMRRTDKAKENFVKVLELEPKNSIAIKELAHLFYSYRQYDKAIELAQKCTDCPDANKIIGMSYYQQEDYAAAEKALLLATKQDPNDAETMYTLGRNYLDMESYLKAVPYYERAVNMAGAKSMWIYELALLHYNNADYKRSVIAFTKAAEAGYEQKNDFNENFGYALLYAGDFSQGEEKLLGVLKRKPNNTTMLRDMADAFYQQKQYDKSLEYCQKLLTLDGKDAKALYQAGLCFQKKGEKDRGQQMCDKAIEMDPSLESLRRKKEMPGGL